MGVRGGAGWGTWWGAGGGGGGRAGWGIDTGEGWMKGAGQQRGLW